MPPSTPTHVPLVWNCPTEVADVLLHLADTFNVPIETVVSLFISGGAEDTVKRLEQFSSPSPHA